MGEKQVREKIIMAGIVTSVICIFVLGAAAMKGGGKECEIE